MSVGLSVRIKRFCQKCKTWRILSPEKVLEVNEKRQTANLYHSERVGLSAFLADLFAYSSICEVQVLRWSLGLFVRNSANTYMLSNYS